VPGGTRIELAWDGVRDWMAEARRLFGLSADASLARAHDAHSVRESIAYFEGTRLVFALYISAEPVLVSRQWAVDLLSQTFEGQARLQVLAGRPAGDVPDPGPIVCGCFAVGSRTIADAIDKHGLGSVEAIGRHLRAGTNCGSCRPEIAAILTGVRSEAAGGSDQGASGNKSAETTPLVAEGTA
jgi:assimilatory nitrate reductase catalytic subunit